MKTFMICHLGALGDFILTWPALRSLRSTYPDLKFMGIGRAEYMKLAVRTGLLDDFLDMESKEVLQLFSGQEVPPSLEPLAGAVVWMQKEENFKDLLKERATLPVMVISPFSQNQRHLADQYCHRLQQFFPIEISDWIFQSLSFMENVPKRTVLIHPGSGSEAKNFHPDFYNQISHKMKKIGYPEVYFVMGPAELDRGLSAYFDEQFLIKMDEISAFLKLLQHTKLFIGNDSGPSHLAAILGIPTITYYLHTDPHIWGIIGNHTCRIHTTNRDEAWARTAETIAIWKNQGLL